MAEDIPAKVGPGTTLNGMFVIDERLAAGGMGEVYRGRNIATGDPVAIKVVLAELAKDETVVGLFFKEAKRKNVAVIARVPLASGLLSGKITRDTQFASDDHRNFNRHGEAFDVGETFAGVPFEVGLQAVEEVRKLVPAGASMAAFALRWILMNEAVTVVIPGARNAEQAKANAAAADLAPLSADVMAATREIYERLIAPHVHHRW